MSRQPLPVLTAVTGRWEASLAVALDSAGSDLDVVRRCADLSELQSAAAAGLGRAVLLSADLPRLDRDAVAQLLIARVAVIGLAPPGDDDAILRLNRFGVRRVVAADAPASEISDVVMQAYRQLQERLRRGWDSGDLAMEELEAAEERAAIPGAGVPGIARDATGFADPELWLADVPGPRADRAAGDPAAALPASPLMPIRRGVTTGPAGHRAPGAVIVVWGPVGAPGRTTVAVTLAAELAASGRACLLVDADTYGASIAQSLGLLDESAGLAAAARAANTGQLDVHRLAELAPVVSDRLRVLTGLPQPRRWTELRPSALDVVWEQSRQLADVVVVDAGFGLDADEELMFDTAAPRRHGATLSALAAADLVVAVGAGDPIGLQRLLAALPDLHELTGGAVPVQVVVTKIRDQAIGGSAAARVRGALERYAGIADPVLVPDDRAALDAAMLAGRTLTEIAPASPARLAVSELAHQLRAPGGLLGNDRDGREGRDGPDADDSSAGRRGRPRRTFRRGWRRRGPALERT